MTKRKTPCDTVRTAKVRDAFLAGLEDGMTIAAASKAVGAGRRTMYDWREADTDFAAAWDDAYETGTDVLEDEAKRRAVDGVQEPVIYQGKLSMTKDDKGNDIPLTVRKYSDTMLIFMLKGRRPEKFKDRHEHTGKGGGPIETKEMSGLEIARRLAFILTQGAQNDDGA